MLLPWPEDARAEVEPREGAERAGSDRDVASTATAEAPGGPAEAEDIADADLVVLAATPAAMVASLVPESRSPTERLVHGLLSAAPPLGAPIALPTRAWERSLAGR